MKTISGGGSQLGDHRTHRLDGGLKDLGRARAHDEVRGEALTILERIGADDRVRVRFWIAPSGPAIMPSPRRAGTVSDSILVPVFKVGAMASIIAWRTDGTPAITCTLPMRKPGALETIFSIRSRHRGCGPCACGLR